MYIKSKIRDRQNKVLVVGLGMIGSSYAQKLRQEGIFVGGISGRLSTVEYAIEHGIIDEGTIEVEPEFVGKFDIVIFAVYPQLLLEWIERYQAYFKSGAVITDVTGVKCGILYKIQDMLRDDVEMIGAHPMAGREVSGIENGNPAVFHGANYLITPTAKNTDAAIDIAREIGELLEFGSISLISPEEHDEMIAFLSQLTHCIAVSLMCCKESDKLVKYTGDSFRDLTRIANINGDMWSELFSMNREQLLVQMELFSSQFNRLRKAIEEDDFETMKDMMRLSTERRSHFNKK